MSQITECVLLGDTSYLKKNLQTLLSEFEDYCCLLYIFYDSFED